MKKIFIAFTVFLVNYGVFSQKQLDKLNHSSEKLTKKEAVLTATTVNCKIKGSISGEKSTYLMLVTEKDNPFQSGIKIPIVGGKFEYDIFSPFFEKYTLILGEELEKGAFRPITFFSENGLVEFDLHTAEEFDKNIVSGGKLNSKMISFEKKQKEVFGPMIKPFSEEIDLLWDSNKYFSEEVIAIQDKIKNLEHGEELNKLYEIKTELLKTEKGYTPRAWFLKDKMDSIQKINFDWETKYIRVNQDIFSYSLLLKNVSRY